MKAVILAGGFGTRISEESHLKPKPMIEIGGKPILWHIMKIYSHHGINDFIICLGYKGYIIKEYFNHYFLHMSDVTFDMPNNKMEVHHNHVEPWRVTLIDTGEHTQTGGRLKRVKEYLGNEDFCFTYGDGLANVDIQSLLTFHKEQQSLATVTAVQPPSRWGAVELDGDKIRSFSEKPIDGSGWINGGFFILSPEVFDFIDGDQSIWEKAPMESLAAQSQLSAYKHRGFWQSMDTLRERNLLEGLWADGKAPWKFWN